MMAEERRKVDENLPSVYRKVLILGGLGCGIGAGIGAFVGWYIGSDVYPLFAGGGALLGCILGNLLGVLMDKKISLSSLQQTEKNYHMLIGLLSFLLSLAGLVGFFLTGRWLGIAGAIFFGFVGIYSITKHRIASSPQTEGFLSLLMAMMSLIVFLLDRGWIGLIGLVGALFFGLGGIFLIIRHRGS
jgi:hypothetical protein